MKARLKIYGYIILLANIILFAHSFVPHNHEHDVIITNNSCSCSDCLSVSVSSTDTPASDNCGCCSKGGNCFISFGYFSHGSEDFHDLEIPYTITPVMVLNTATVAVIPKFTYAKLSQNIPDLIILSGIGMRAPPVLFS